MKYIEDFRDPQFARALLAAIAREADTGRHYQFMEFCGGHTHAIYRFGLPKLLPSNVELVHGPGCPVCVLPMSRIDKALALAARPEVILCTYADMLRVPGSGGRTLMQARSEGAAVRMVYSVDDALQIACEQPQHQVVFFAIGFETTTPPTAVALQQAKALGLENFSVFCNHVLTPVAMAALLDNENVRLDGFIGPAHVSIVTGSQAYESVSQNYQKPIVIAGFEPLDILHAILMLIRQINNGQCRVDIQYTRAVTPSGNQAAQHLMEDVFAIRERFEWRGLGFIPHSALQIADKYGAFDAEKRFCLPETQSEDHKQCICGDVLRGLQKPKACKLFAKVCSPDNPLGSCMVSSEGACAAVYAYEREEVA